MAEIHVAWSCTVDEHSVHCRDSPRRDMGLELADKSWIPHPPLWEFVGIIIPQHTDLLFFCN